MLIGYQNPLDDYPALVIPIVRVRGKHYAVHEAERSVYELEPLNPRESFRRLDVVAGELASFDYERQGLLALGPEDITAYRRTEMETLFRRLLSDSDFAAHRPFTRYSFARLAKVPEVLGREFAHCLSWLVLQEHIEGTPHDHSFIESWYEAQVTELGASVGESPWLEALEFPSKWDEAVHTNWYAGHFLRARDHKLTQEDEDNRAEPSEFFPSQSSTYSPLI